MRLNWSEVEIAMAEANLSKGAVAARMKAASQIMADLKKRASEGSEIEPKTAGRLAKAIGVEVRRIILQESPPAETDQRQGTAA